MNTYRPPALFAAGAIFLHLLAAPAPAGGLFAATVIDYHPGAGVSLTNPYSAAGAPGGIVGAGSGFDSVYSPFSPHFEAHELVQIGEGGALTLRLERTVITDGVRAEIGIFTNVALIDGDFPNGLNSGSFGADSVTVEVSADGLSWASLGDVACDFPGNAFADSPSPFHPSPDDLTPADFSKPHGLRLSDLDGGTHAEILEMLDGSAGGTWIDTDAAGIPAVAYIRLSVADDGDPETQRTFELAGVSTNSEISGPAPAAIGFVEDFATDPLGTRASTTPGHASYSAGALSANYDLGSPGARTVWPLGTSLSDARSFSYSVGFTIDAIAFDTSNFGQVSFGLINSTTTGERRTSAPADSWDLLTVDYFPNPDFTTLTPTVIGSQRPGQTDAFANLGFPSLSASLINEPGEIGQLPTATQLTVSVDYDAPTRVLTLRLHDQAINAFGANPDGDETTIEYTIPGRITFSVDSFAVLCWEEASGGTASLSFTEIRVSTPGPPANYFSWADANIAEPICRAPQLDANSDGLSNLLNYAMGDSAPTTSPGGDSLVLRWQEIPARSDVEIEAQSSRDLNRWDAVSDSIINSGPGIELHQASLDLSAGGGFLRLAAKRK